MEDLIKLWIVEFQKQNDLLKEDGDDQLTVADFLACRIEDAFEARLRRHEEQAREWWATYRAALTGLIANPESNHWKFEDAHSYAAQHASAAHGPLEQSVRWL